MNSRNKHPIFSPTILFLFHNLFYGFFIFELERNKKTFEIFIRKSIINILLSNYFTIYFMDFFFELERNKKTFEIFIRRNNSRLQLYSFLLFLFIVQIYYLKLLLKFFVYRIRITV